MKRSREETYDDDYDAGATANPAKEDDVMALLSVDLTKKEKKEKEAEVAYSVTCSKFHRLRAVFTGGGGDLYG